MDDIVVGGVYEHYKHRRYQVVCVAMHSETLDPLVVYRALYGTQELWARPKSMFTEQVTVEGTERPRFVYVGHRLGRGGDLAPTAVSSAAH
jgi:hypothetical protein